MSEQMRLNKYLASRGICSRREADHLIERGMVFVNGNPASMGQTVSDADEVRVGKKVLGAQQKKVVLAYYKPIGVTCSEKDSHAKKLITDMIQYPVRLTYAGRLDRESEGLILMTNDGELIQSIMKGSAGHEKEYIVKVNKEITDEFVRRMSEGLYLKDLDVTTRPCQVVQIGKYTFSIILTQGLNRQIRRMCKTLGYQVSSLKRIRIMNIALGDLKPNTWREVKGEELQKLCSTACRS